MLTVLGHSREMCCAGCEAVTRTFSRLAVYSGGFFVFWVFAAASSALTCFPQRTAEEINLKKEDTNAAC